MMPNISSGREWRNTDNEQKQEVNEENTYNRACATYNLNQAAY